MLWRFTIALAASAVLVFAVGWWTDLRDAMHGALLAVATFAFLPFILIAAGFAIAALLMVASVFAALVGDGGDPVVSDLGVGEAGVAIMPGYYRFLVARFAARRRHPIFWGVPIGIAIGGLALWGVIALIVVPGEMRTAEILAEAKTNLDQRYTRTSPYPDATPGGHLRRTDAAIAGEGDVVLDGFGRPLRYEKRGHWKVASYVVRSDGYDAKPGGDDMCQSGATKFGAFAGVISLGRSSNRGVSVKLRLEGIREMQCGRDE